MPYLLHIVYVGVYILVLGAKRAVNTSESLCIANDE